MALEEYFEDAILMKRETVSDGLGDTMEVYLDDEYFRAGFSMVSSTQAEIAYRNGTKTIYHITTAKPGMLLEAGDVVKRVRDDRLYRVTNKANETPDVARVQQRVVSAEVIE